MFSSDCVNAINQVNKIVRSILIFFPWMFTPGRRSSNILTWLFFFIMVFQHILWRDDWIFSPTFSTSSQLTPSLAEATTLRDRLFNNGSSKSNDLCASNQDQKFLRSWLLCSIWFYILVHRSKWKLLHWVHWQPWLIQCLHVLL